MQKQSDYSVVSLVSEKKSLFSLLCVYSRKMRKRRRVEGWREGDRAEEKEKPFFSLIITRFSRHTHTHTVM